MKEEEHPMRSDMIQLDGKSSIKLVKNRKTDEIAEN